ncbi:MAG: transcription antitermination factor NusB [Defluviitaleaceae bacterium]|nr:transcription antitermination factor NusB [Defluviitaleaceae bacterium]
MNNESEKIQKMGNEIKSIKRKTAREYAFALVYEKLISGERNEFSKSVAKEKLEGQADFFDTLLSTVDNNFDFLQKTIAEFSTGFKLERIYKVDLALLLLAVGEILFLDDIPDLVALNEALELAKMYSSEKSSKFIHGVLSSVIDKKEELLENYKV